MSRQTEAHDNVITGIFRDWRRSAMSLLWAAVVILGIMLAVPMAVHAVKATLATWMGTEDTETIRAECKMLEREIDALIHQSRRQSAKAMAAKDPQAEIVRLLTAAGLTLVEVSREVAAPKTKDKTVKWRVVAFGPAPKWGVFLSFLESSIGTGGIVSVTWSTRSWVDAEPRGEFVLAFPRGDGS